MTKIVKINEVWKATLPNGLELFAEVGAILDRFLFAVSRNLEWTGGPTGPTPTNHYAIERTEDSALKLLAEWIATYDAVPQDTDD